MKELWDAVGGESAHRLELKRLDSNPPNRLHVHYIAASTKEEQLTLTFVPTSTKVLRVERASVKAEAMLLHWLSDSDLSPPADKRQQNSETPRKGSQETDADKKLSECRFRIRDTLPRVIRRGRAKLPDDVEFLITKGPHGVVLASLAEPLTRFQQKHLHLQIGQLIRDISRYHSPIDQFGVASVVLEAAGIHHDLISAPLVQSQNVMNNAMCATWSGAFLSLLESALRDAEDAAVSLEYEKIRLHSRRFKQILDEVTVPSLVILDAGEEFNTRVATTGGCAKKELEYHEERCFGAEKSTQTAIPTSKGNQFASKAQEDNEHGSKSLTVPTSIQCSSSILHVIGIQDWHNSVFGDPLFTSVLTRNEHADIWDGLVHPIGDDEEPTAIRQARSLVGNVQHAEVRRLLYDCYHSIAAIVTEHYRMAVDGDDRELPARRRLVRAISRLDNLDDLGGRIHPRPSSDQSASKRQKHG